MYSNYSVCVCVRQLSRHYIFKKRKSTFGRIQTNTSFFKELSNSLRIHIGSRFSGFSASHVYIPNNTHQYNLCILDMPTLLIQYRWHF